MKIEIELAQLANILLTIGMLLFAGSITVALFAVHPLSGIAVLGLWMIAAAFIAHIIKDSS